jgi:hypothetical protein
MDQDSLEYTIRHVLGLEVRIRGGQVEAKKTGCFQRWKSVGSVQTLSLLPHTRLGEAH